MDTKDSSEVAVIVAETLKREREHHATEYRANLERIAELVADAEEKRSAKGPAPDPNWLFYDGVVTGLRRAVMVLEGRG